MANKQQLQLNNETLASILSNVLGLPSQESLKHGAYAWKKYFDEIVMLDSVTITASRPTTTTMKFESTGIDLSKLTSDTYADFFNGLSFGTSTSNSISFSKSGSGLVFGYAGATTGYSVSSWDSANKQLVFAEAFGTSYGVGDNTVKTGMRILVKSAHEPDFVVSDSETAYPDGGLQDGYWYEKVVEGLDLKSVFGYTKMAVDKITFPSDTNLSGSTIPHSLGEKPSMYIFVGESISITDYSYVKSIMGMDNPAQTSYSPSLYAFYANASSGIFSPVNLSTSISDLATSIKVTNTSLKLKAGIEYTLITMA